MREEKGRSRGEGDEAEGEGRRGGGDRSVLSVQPFVTSNFFGISFGIGSVLTNSSGTSSISASCSRPSLALASSASHPPHMLLSPGPPELAVPMRSPFGALLADDMICAAICS